MLKLNQGSGSFDISPKTNPSSSTYSEGTSTTTTTSEFNPKLFVSLQRKPSNIVNKPEKRIVRVSEMHQQVGDLQQELNQMQDKLSAVEEQRDRAFDELREMKNVAEVANMKLSEAMSSPKVSDIYTEYEVAKESLKSARKELSTKEKQIDFLKIQLGKRKELEKKMEEKDSMLEKLKEQLSNIKASEACTNDLLSDSMKKIESLEAELEKVRQSEDKLYDTLAMQTKVLELTKISLEEAKTEIAALRKDGGCFEDSPRKGLRESRTFPKDYHLMRGSSKRLDVKYEYAHENIRNILLEKEVMKNELKMATESEENSKKAMDDLAIALKEVATEAKQVKLKLNTAEEELKKTRVKAENLKSELKNVEASFKVQLQNARKEADTYRNKAVRLRMEAEDTLLTWTGKETCFVNCIKKVEEEKSILTEENRKLQDTLVAAQNTAKTAKEDSAKVRDLLKQAINEANAAKEAASISQIENSQLKDAIAEKDNALNFISQDNETLKINEAAANKYINELKRLLAEASEKDNKKSEEKEHVKKSKHHKSSSDIKEQKDNKKTSSDSKEQKDSKKTASDNEQKDSKKLNKSESVNIKELKIPHKHKDMEEDPKNSIKHVDSSKHTDDKKHIKSPKNSESNAASAEDDDSCSSGGSDPLKGSIFDTDAVDFPMEAPTHHRKKSSSVFTEDSESINLEEFDHIFAAHYDELDSEKSSRKKKALLRRFGDLIKRRSVPKKEPSPSPSQSPLPSVE